MIGNAAKDASAVLQALGRALAIIEFKPDGTILAANENFCRTVGYEASEIVGRHHRMFVAPEEAASAEYAAFWAKLARGEYDAREYKRFGKGGKEVWIQASYNPVFDRKGRVVKVVKAATDITGDKMRSEESAGKLDAISRAQAVIEFTNAGEIITANENFLATVGYTLDEIRGRHHRIFVEPAYSQTPEYSELWRRLNAGEFIAAEFKRFGKGGKEVWIQASYNPIFDLNRKVVKIIKYATDVSERVRTVAEIADGLSALANNDLEVRLDRPFDTAFERLRNDFNHSLDHLQKAIVAIGESARSIDSGVHQISTASSDLSLRTEQQAASLEETAAALAEITTTVQKSAEDAQQAMQVAVAAKADAVRSGEVVDSAVAAMVEINNSSGKITQIIGVIDEIAFQTNLLALNAGVEAARAGEAGKGFAVVAQEVRALAQRSAEAAKEIKTLIASSSEQVKRGVTLVGDTGQALRDIVVKVGEMDALIAAMGKATRDQSTGLTEVNTAVNQMDQVTQKNAAMAEEATAAATSVASEAKEMSRLLSEFRTGAGAGKSGRSEAGAPVRLVAGATKARAAANPVRQSQARLVTALRSGGAEVATDSWDEF